MPSDLAVGIDLVEVERFADALGRRPRLEARVFTDHERATCRRSTARSAERFAARFAAKEAAFKALGEGWPRLRYHEVEVVSHGGAPLLRFSGRAAQMLGGGSATVSLSHAGGLAAALVIVVGGPR